MKWVLINMKYCFLFLLIFLYACTTDHTLSSKENIQILPYGHFPEGQIDKIKEAVDSLYGFKVAILPAETMPKSFFINEKSPRYRADSIIKHLHKRYPKTITLALTTKDISTTKRDKLGRTKKPASRYADWGIFGLGYIGQSGCVVSSFRYGGKNKIERLQKICLHEIGHNLGLSHCPNSCLMADAAETIRTVDRVPMRLCENCQSKAF